MDSQKPCSEDSVSVTKTNCAAGTDGNRGGRSAEVVRASQDGVSGGVGIAGLRCWLHPNMYVFIIPRLMDRQKESGRRRAE